jgi:hypothetical protein
LAWAAIWLVIASILAIFAGSSLAYYPELGLHALVIGLHVFSSSLICYLIRAASAAMCGCILVLIPGLWRGGSGWSDRDSDSCTDHCFRLRKLLRVRDH